MTLNQLECFMVLAQRLNFTQAADDLFMAQPALSRLISALEKELDLQLFYRNSRSVALTPAGTVFFKKCPKILDEYRGSVVAARLAQEGYRGSLTLGIMRDTFEPKLPTLYQRFRTAYPHVSLLIRGYSHSSLLSALERGEVDGLWHTVLDDSTSYEETSGSAAITAGILKGIRMGILDDSYLPCAKKAIRAILKNIDTDGTVLKVSGGTGMGYDRDHYKNILIAPMAYGQSLTILALVEALETFE